MTKLIALMCVLALGCGAELPPDYYYEEAEIGELEQALSVPSNYGRDGDNSPVNSDLAGCGTAPYDKACLVPADKVFDACFGGNSLPPFSQQRQLVADAVSAWNFQVASGTGYFIVFHDGLCSQQQAWPNVIRIYMKPMSEVPFVPQDALGAMQCVGWRTSGSIRNCWISDIYFDWDAVIPYTSAGGGWGVPPYEPRVHVLLHEFGHAAGLEHNSDSNTSSKLMNTRMTQSNYLTRSLTASQKTAMQNFVDE